MRMKHLTCQALTSCSAAGRVEELGAFGDRGTMCRCPCVSPIHISSFGVGEGSGWAKKRKKGTWVVTRVSFLLPTPPCFVLIRSLTYRWVISHISSTLCILVLKGCLKTAAKNVYEFCTLNHLWAQLLQFSPHFDLVIWSNGKLRPSV